MPTLANRNSKVFTQEAAGNIATETCDGVEVRLA